MDIPLKGHALNRNHRMASTMENNHRVKVREKEPSTMWIVFKYCFLKIWKIIKGTLYIKNKMKNRNKFLYFQSCNYKIFMKIHHVSIVFYMFKAFKTNMWTSGFLYHMSFSPNKCSSFFLWTLIYSTRRDQCVQNIPKVKIHIPY
jgi:hypothetical protein